MSPKEKIEWMEWILQHETLGKHVMRLSRKKEKNFFRKLLLRAIQTGQVGRALQLMNVRNNIASNYGDLFMKTKSWFT
jgi:hypothetical protein